MNNNTYADRTKLRVPPRQDHARLAVLSNLPEIPPESDVMTINEPDVPMALPTIPIMKYVSTKNPQAFEPKPAVLSRYRPIDNIISDKPKKYIKTEDKKPVQQERVEPEQVANSATAYDHEPTTKPLEAGAAKNKITRHRRPIIKQIPLALAIIVTLSATSYAGFSLMDSGLGSGSNKNTSVLGASTKMAADLPAKISIDSIGLYSKISLASHINDELVVLPSSMGAVGWYQTSAKPGQSGATVLAGRADAIDGKNGVFSFLKNINNGDKIALTRNDGKKLVYMVSNVEVLQTKSIDDKKLFQTYANAEQGLSIITNTGESDVNGNSEYRLFVQAVVTE